MHRKEAGKGEALGSLESGPFSLILNISGMSELGEAMEGGKRILLKVCCPILSYQGEDVQWLKRHQQTVTSAVSVGHVNRLDLEGLWRERASSGFRGSDKQGCREQNAV